MLCKRPFRQGVLEYGCGQCMPCRIDRRRLWSTRLMLEARKHQASLFVTLTYRPEDLPNGATLVPKHMQDWLKRLRFHCDPMRVRFYGVGEYGELGGRPHYHVCLFGSDGDRLARYARECWDYGLVDIRILSWDLAWYVVGYICKRFTKFGGDLAKNWLAGRHPEFCRMSLKPGIGAGAMEDIARELHGSKALARVVAETGDIPYLVRIQGKTLPLGRYLARRLRVEYGGSGDVPDPVLRRVALKQFVELGGFGTLLDVRAARELRERRRVAVGRNADARYIISKSKRSL